MSLYGGREHIILPFTKNKSTASIFYPWTVFMDMHRDAELTCTNQQQQEAGWLDRKEVCAWAGPVWRHFHATLMLLNRLSVPTFSVCPHIKKGYEKHLSNTWKWHIGQIQLSLDGVGTFVTQSCHLTKSCKTAIKMVSKMDQDSELFRKWMWF